tara:strand:+ start:1886 stop:2314 length:429 start_codon:yes stop_codon:yes gene_type:complete
MKLVTKIATIATLASFMFAGVNLTWGNAYTDSDGDLGAAGSFGVHFDVNDNTTVGWEGGLMVGLAGPAGTTFRLGYSDVPTLGMSYTWWEGAGTGWGTALSTAVDFDMVNGAEDVDGDGNGLGTYASDAGDFTITVNLGLGF